MTATLTKAPVVTRTGYYVVHNIFKKNVSRSAVLEYLQSSDDFSQNQQFLIADRVEYYRENPEESPWADMQELVMVEVAVARGTLKVTEVKVLDQDFDDKGRRVYMHQFKYELTL